MQNLGLLRSVTGDGNLNDVIGNSENGFRIKIVDLR